ncbi:unnamed protein product [Parnassius mnemosyne]|uniref:DDE-1 domain-containing protein n=1 Tax=Parnassius mnemosyne TaxID=213953 RepID=A0AAV1KDQ0_9NEOP
MVRSYKRKTTPTYDLETLKKAVDEVKTDKINSYQAAKKYNIPRMTICDRVNNKKGIVKESRGPPTVIDRENELKLANGLRVMEKYGFGLTSKETLDLVAVHVSENNYKTPFKNNRPGYDWFAAFKKRHNLSLKRPQAVEMSRKVTCDPFIVNEYFDTLDGVLSELNLKGRPDKIWNLDESSFGKDPERTKVVGARGCASTRTIASSGKDNVTILFTVNAIGDKLPPLIIHRGKNTWDQWLSDKGFENTSYAATKNGWIDTKVFEKYMLNTVLPRLSEDPPALLICDGLSTHIQLKILEEAQKRGVTIIKLPSHASHLLQPLDLSVFKSMKNTWDAKLVHWQRLNVGNKLPKDEFSRLLGEVWRELDTKIIRNGFKKGGIYPFDRNVVADEKFDPESLKRFREHKTIPKQIQTLKKLSLAAVTQELSISKNPIAASSKLVLPNQEMKFDKSNDSKVIRIIEDRILAPSERVSFETLLLQTIKKSDSTIKLKKTKIARGCEIITREQFIDKKRYEEKIKQEKERTAIKIPKTKNIKKKLDQNRKRNCIKLQQQDETDESKDIKKKPCSKSLSKQKPNKNVKKKAKKQKKCFDYDEESESELDISFAEVSGSAELSDEDFDTYRENFLAEIKSDDNFLED